MSGGSYFGYGGSYFGYVQPLRKPRPDRRRSSECGSGVVSGDQCVVRLQTRDEERGDGRMSEWPEIAPPALPYYDRTDLDLAIAATREQIDEWDYNDDPHGYCHFRSLYAQLILAAEWARNNGYPAT